MLRWFSLLGAPVARWPVSGRVSCLRWLVVNLPRRGTEDSHRGGGSDAACCFCCLLQFLLLCRSYVYPPLHLLFIFFRFFILTFFRALSLPLSQPSRRLPSQRKKKCKHIDFKSCVILDRGDDCQGR